MSESPSPTTQAVAERLAALGGRVVPVMAELIPRGRDDYLSDAIWHHLDTGGKRIRPALCLLACERLGGDPDRALYFATAIELMHNMFLIHDDLEDGDTMRRDREAVWVRYGMANAVNVGDYLLGVAYRAILRCPVDEVTMVRLLREFAETYESTCRGQAMDLNRRAMTSLTVDDYLHMVTLKTGRYLALGMVGGAMIAGAARDVIECIRELARSMGAAFQIRDDVIDLTAGKGRGGVIGCDIREGKPSILYAHALNAADAQDRATLVEVMARPREQTTDDDVREVRGLYERVGSLEFAAAEADRLIQEAYGTVERLPVQEKEFFHQVVSHMVSRSA